MPKRIIDEENFLTFVGKSDTRALPSPSERSLGEELSGKKNYQAKIIDQFEKNLGIMQPKKKRNVKYKHKVFNLDYEKDSELFNELMNNPKYEIITSKDTWTVEGLYKVAVVYAEDLDYQSSDDKLKDIAEGK